jgi:uncharacterized membrane protein
MAEFSFESKGVQIIFWVIVIIVFIYLYLHVEPRHNACWDEDRNDCFLDVFRVDPKEGDTNADLLRRLEGYTKLDTEKVFWRRSILNAIIISALLLMLYYRKLLIPIQPFLIIVLVLFILFYFHNSYYTMHFDQRSNIFAQATINEIRYRLNLATRPTAKDFTHVY